MAINTDVISAQANSGTMSEKRDVADKLRALYPSYYLQALIQSGPQPEFIKGRKVPGLIKKRAVKNIRFENYVYAPPAFSITATADLAGTTQAVSDGTLVRPKYTIVNTANDTVAWIDSISTNDLTITSIGDTAFACTSGDELLIMATAYEEGSDNPAKLMKDDDNIYNTLQTVRFPFAVSWESAKTPLYYEPNGNEELYLKKAIADGMIKVENTLLFGQRSASGNKTTTGTSIDVHTTRGLRSWAQGEFDAAGGLTPSTFFTDVMEEFDDSTSNESMKIGFCANRTLASMQQWANQQLIINDSGEKKEYGVNVSDFRTSRGIVRMYAHGAYQKGSLQNQIDIFDPKELFYAYKEGLDLRINKNIEGNAEHAKSHELTGVVGLGTFDGGRSIVTVKNAF